jgi:hypothetical protein
MGERAVPELVAAVSNLALGTLASLAAGIRTDPRLRSADPVLSGEAATKAAAEDGEESPPPNDCYIRNVNSRLRTLLVRPDAPITVNVLAAQSTGSSTKDVSVTLAKPAGYLPNSGTAPFWITVEQGQVTKIAQQFVYPVHWPRPSAGGTSLACSCPRGGYCDRPAKHPLVWHGVKDASCDPAQLARWWQTLA